MQGDGKDGGTRQRILSAASRIAMERGYKDTTIALIQKAAGVHPGSFYWHFKDKDALFAAMVREAQQTTEVMPRSLEGDAANPVMGVLRSIVDRPERYGLWRFNVQLMMDRGMQASSTAGEIRKLRELTQHNLTVAWLEQIPDEVFEAHPDLPRQLADYSLATIEGCILSRVAGTPRDEEFITGMSTAVLDRMVELACQGVGVPVPPFIEQRGKPLARLVERTQTSRGGGTAC
ncbi:TetR/AcrR family transcriptional regulator [Luteococcus sp. Sow4_B9]|uniref:TetR/AcrR family transcriptional regulator n=1 Tax=Luteococcus sp. Sow4_B9 TaxID=3438792 RepID=UPI003F9C86D1